jgi:deoxyribose-phosphate aldolase
VCVNSSFVPLASRQLQDTEVKVCSVVGFPLGAMSTEAKVFETEQAIRDGADEIDMVIHIGCVKSGLFDAVEGDISAVRKASHGKILKVILETSLLEDDEKIKVCEIAKKLKVDFVKTSTGFSTGGATVEDIRLMKSIVGNEVQIKASGGIRDTQKTLEMIEAGATRIGASAGIAIVKGSGLDDLLQSNESSAGLTPKGY